MYLAVTGENLLGEKAVLPGFCRLLARGAVFPVLKEDPKAKTPGLLVLPGERAFEKIRYFEEEGILYRLRQERALRAGSEIECNVFYPFDEKLASTSQWDFQTWLLKHKAYFVRNARNFMRDF